MASRSGLPVHKLAIATNANNILSRCYHTGDYKKGDVSKTESPSMDIQISSNFERLLFDLYGRDDAAMRDLHNDLREKRVQPSADAIARFKGIFLADYANDEETFATIKNVFETTDRLIDPHSAVGVTVSQKLGLDKADVPVVNLACAACKIPRFC